MPAIVGPDTLLEDAARFAAHPDFGAAILAYTAGLARLREAPRLVNMVISTDVRWRVVGYLMYLDADRERFGPLGGATFSRLLEACMARNEASPRAVRSVLALLQFGGLVRVVPSLSDRRVRFYRPTERMFGFVRQWLGYGTAALDILEPELERSRLIDDQAFMDAYSVSGGRAHLQDPVPLVDRVPAPLSSLKHMLGSYSVIVAVVLARLEGRAAPSHHDMARRYGLSRAQVSNVMAAGLNQGLFTLDASGNIEPTSQLRAGFQHWISIELAFYARHMRLPATSAVYNTPEIRRAPHQA